MNTVIEEYKRKKKRKTIGEYTVRYAVSVVLLAILLFPYLFMVSKSFMSITDINASVIKLFPTKPSFENYLQLGEYFKYFFNSFVVVIVNAVLVPLTSCLVAYPLARARFKGRNQIFALILATSMIPSSVLQVPQYLLFRDFGLYDKLASQFIGAFSAGAECRYF